MTAGLPAIVGLAAGAFAGTNVDNAVVTVAMVATAPPERARRIATGQVIGFVVLVLAAIGMAVLLFEISTRVIGLLGLVPLVLGLRGLAGLRHPEGRARVARRAFGSGVTAATVITLGAGGDNLAVYIPLFRVARFGGTAASLLVFALGEALFTILVLRAGRHRRVRAALTAFGVFAAPVLYCAIGVLVLVESGTFSLFG
jgi:cadmium resistance protein CadD (predicted permease)